MVNYTYDAWGNILSVTGPAAETVGQKNSLRYRGYYYDAETGFYALQSRYYDPETGRFINADNQLTTGSYMTGMNLFAYCGNNPITGYVFSTIGYVNGKEKLWRLGVNVAEEVVWHWGHGF